VREIRRAIQRINQPSVIVVIYIVLTLPAFFRNDAVCREVRGDELFEMPFAGEVGFGDEVDAALVRDLKAALRIVLQDGSGFACSLDRQFDQIHCDDCLCLA